jgi:intraflagellar transport protein 172
MDHYAVRAKLAILEKQFKLAENIYLEQGRIDDAMSMYQEIHKWDQSIKVAEARNHPELESLKHNYYEWLVESNQEEKAGALSTLNI